MAARIRDTGPASVQRYVATVVRNKVINEASSRHRTIPLAVWEGERTQTGGRIPEQDTKTNVESLFLAGQGAWAAALGFDLLPVFVEPSFVNTGRDIEIFRLTHVEGLSFDRARALMGLAKVQRQWAARGRELLRGWVFALCGSEPRPDKVNATYWDAGFNAGSAYRRRPTSMGDSEQLAGNTAVLLDTGQGN
jgi:hypothetical protein